MSKISGANVKNVVLSIRRFAKEVTVTGAVNEEDVSKPVQKETCLTDAARYMLHEAIMDYIHVQKSNTITSEENTGRVSKRVVLTRRNK